MSNKQKYRFDDTLQNLIDWENIMEMDRCARGHNEQMCGLFKNAEVLGHYNSGDCQGTVATCVKLKLPRKRKPSFIIYNDYYGTCSGCDSWKDADDDDVRSMCISLANSAYVFDSLEDVKEFLRTGETHEQGDDRFVSYRWAKDDYNNVCSGLLEAIEKQERGEE